jgi:hypothetical protein
MKILLSLFIVFMFAACAPVYTKHEASVITFKTSEISFADAGFIHDNGEDVKVIILVVGQAVFTLEVGRKVCLDGKCFSKKKFVKEKLSPFYGEDILQNIFLGKPIFNSEALVKVDDGFKQKLFKESAYDISYSVIGDKIRFKDKIRKILIKTKKIKQEKETHE